MSGWLIESFSRNERSNHQPKRCARFRENPFADTSNDSINKPSATRQYNRSKANSRLHVVAQRSLCAPDSQPLFVSHVTYWQMSLTTSDQTLSCDCRTRFMLGYQAVVDPAVSQRQSGTLPSITVTGTPIAPAKWAIDVSLVMT